MKRTLHPLLVLLTCLAGMPRPAVEAFHNLMPDALRERLGLEPVPSEERL